MHYGLKINYVIIGNAVYPSELIRVKTEMCDYLVQVFYVSGGQVSICNYQHGHTVTASIVSAR